VALAEQRAIHFQECFAIGPQQLRQSARCGRFTDAGWPKEQQRRSRPTRITGREAETRPVEHADYRFNRTLLPEDCMAKFLLYVIQRIGIATRRPDESVGVLIHGVHPLLVSAAGKPPLSWSINCG
jgi:hypothetical protein